VRNRQVLRLAAPLLVLALGAAACGGGDDDASDTPTTSASTTGAAQPKGGVLKVLSTSEQPNFDTAPAYDTNSYFFLRAYQRQLYTNHADNDPAKRLDVVPDLADGLPDISSDGTVYTIKIKPDVKWNTPDARTITAQDAIRGFQFMCNPILSFGSPGFYTDSIVGFKEFCDGFTGLVKGEGDAAVSPDPAAMKAFVDATPIAGLKAVDDKTLQMTLKAPVADMMHLLTLPTVSPRPVEALAYEVDGPQFRQNVVESGPYQIASYEPEKTLKLTRNPNWSNDDVREANVDSIEVTFGVANDSITQQIEAGTADVAAGNTPVGGPDLARLGDSKLLSFNPTGGTNPYIVINTLGGKPELKNAKVRQALNYAANKRALVQAAGGTKVAVPATQIFSKEAVGEGFVAQDLYKTDGSQGDPQKAKDLLSEAGYPNGISLSLAYRNNGNNAKYSQVLQEDMAKAGITLTLKPIDAKDFYSRFIQKSAVTKAGEWDLSLPGWSPDWEGSAQRSYFTPLLDGRLYTDGSTNYAAYNNDTVNSKADEALSEKDPLKANEIWTEVDKLVMEDAPWVPLLSQTQVNIRSARTSGYAYYTSGQNGDITKFSITS
jgi:peptide/nickel transport system substrate-binding protein